MMNPVTQESPPKNQPTYHNETPIKALVLGTGGREHALVRALAKSPSVKTVIAAPGSDGIAHSAKFCFNWDGRDVETLIAFARKEQINLVVVGPENYLADGIADSLRAVGIDTFGPNQIAARLESSKIFAKQFMVEAGIPTARFHIVASVDEALRGARDFAPPFVLKADGLAAGKGVFICADESELRAAAEALFVDRALGSAGERALLEEFTPGYELSFLALVNEAGHEPLPLAQDHKRLFDGDLGPNTGGMGTIAPMEIPDALRARIERDVFEPAIAMIKQNKFVYNGVLFVGLMIGPEGPSVLEFNVRFGDPETQVILPLLDGDWGVALREVAQGRMPRLKWKLGAAACIVLAAAGYPEAPVKGTQIDLRKTDDGEASYFLHAGTRCEGDRWLTAGGRVLNAIGEGPTINDALAQAYACTAHAPWVGRQMRGDIGVSASAQAARDKPVR